MTTRNITTKVGFKVDDAALKNVEKSLERIRRGVEFLAGVEILKKVGELTERFAQFALELDVASKSAGITVEQMQQLSFAASKSAISAEEMTTAMARLGRRLYEAKNGSSEAQKAFSDAGFSPNQIAGFRTSADAMLALSDRFKAIQDPIKKGALGLELMGRGSKNMAGFLSQGSAAIRAQGLEAQKLGIILSQGQVSALKEVFFAMHELLAVFKALGAVVASYFAPAIKSAIQDFLKWYEVNRKIIDSNLRQWVYDFTFALGYAYEAVKIFVGALLGIAKFFGVENHLLSFFFKLAGAITAAAIAMKLFGLSAIIAWSPWILGITAAVILVQTLWKMLTGGSFSDTWLSKMLSFSWSALKGVAGGIGGVGDSIGGGIRSGIGSIASFANPGVSMGASASNYFNSNVTVNVPPGTDPQMVGQKVKEGIKEHYDRMNREAPRSLRPAKAY